MATEKPRFTITLEEELHRRISHYQHTHHFKSQTQAVIELISKGLMRDQQTTGQIPVLSGEELTMINSWRKCSVDAKSKIRILLTQPISDPDISEEPKHYSPVTLLSLFESADYHIKNDVIAILVDHANEKLQSESPFSGMIDQAKALIEATEINEEAE